MPPPDHVETIHLFARLLSAEKLENNGIQSLGEHIPFEGRNRFLESLFPENNDCFDFTSPALSLVHDDPLQFDHDNVNEAEQSAFSLLSRPMGFVVDPGCGNDVSRKVMSQLSEVGKLLLLNTSESFALLVDSRLRAHAKFLARHGLSASKRLTMANTGIALLDQKLVTLLELGNRVTVTRMEASLEVVEDVGVAQVNSLGRIIRCAVNFQVSLNLSIEGLNAKETVRVPVRYEAQGSLCVHYENEFSKWKLELELDTKELLAQMKLQAAQVVAHVVEMTNTSFIIPEPTFRRGDSYLVMPPPTSPVSGERSLVSSDDKKETISIKDITMKTFALVSPDLSASMPCGGGVPCLMLDDQDWSEASDLSADQCANILDDVFGNIDLSLFSTSVDKSMSDRPSKKAKVNE